jgi:hypothetical protein
VLFQWFGQPACYNLRATNLRSSSLMLSSGHEANISLVRLPEALRRGLSGGSDIQAEGKGVTRHVTLHIAHTRPSERAQRRERLGESVLFPLHFPHFPHLR